MTAESDIAALDDGGANTVAEARTALTSVLARADAGGAVLLDTETISNQANITFSSIPSTHRDLLVVLIDVLTGDGGNQDHPHIQLGNGSIDTGLNYMWRSSYKGASAIDNVNVADDSIPDGPAFPVLIGNGDGGATGSWAFFLIRDYAGSHFKYVTFEGAKGGTDHYMSWGNGMWRSDSAVDILRIIHDDASNFLSGTIELYGLGT